MPEMPKTKSERDEYLLTTARIVFEKCIAEDAITESARVAMQTWLRLYVIASLANVHDIDVGDNP